jgi:AcrR family transcriptional regulator
MKRTKEEAAKTRQDLLDAALLVFSRQGYQSARLTDIAQAAGVTRGAIYHHFGSKSELFSTLMEEASAEYRSIMDSDASWPEKVRKIIRLKLEKTKDMESEFVRDLMASPYPELRGLMEEWASKNLEMLREDFVQGQRKGYVRPDVKPDFLIFLLNQMRNWAVDPALDGLYSSTKEMTEEMVKFFFYGILNTQDQDKDL